MFSELLKKLLKHKVKDSPPNSLTHQSLYRKKFVVPDKSSDWITGGKKVGKSHRGAVVERIIRLFMDSSGWDSCLSLRVLKNKTNKTSVAIWAL